MTEITTTKPRMARCNYYGHRSKYLDPCLTETVSHPDLPFFEDRSGEVDECEHCGYTKKAHETAERDKARHLGHILDHDYEPRGAADHDRFYCGCWGWD